MGEDAAKNDIVAEMRSYTSLIGGYKEYLIHTKIGGELFSKYPEVRANEIINLMSVCLATAHNEPENAKFAMEILRVRFYQMTSKDKALLGMLDENLRNVYDEDKKKFKL
jgi:hypothetical protein